MEKTKVNKVKMVIFLTIIIAGFLVRDLFAMIDDWMILLAIAGGVILCNSDEIICFLFFYLPFSNGLSLTFVVAICWLMFMLRSKNWINNKASFVLLPLFLGVWEFIHGYVLNDGSFYAINLIIIWVSIIFFYEYLKKKNVYIYLKYFVVGIVICCFVILLNTIKVNGWSILASFGGSYRFGNPGFDINFDKLIVSNNQNMLALYCVMGLCAEATFYNKNQKWNIVYCALLLGFGVLTISRTFFICFAVLVLFQIIYLLQFNVGKMLALLVFLGICTAIVLSMVPTLIDNIIERFNEDNGEVSRSSLFALYLKDFISSPQNFIFGIGLEDMATKTGLPQPAHNMFVQMLSGMGIVGTIVALRYMWIFVKEWWTEKAQTHWFELIPCAIVFLFLQTLQLFSSVELSFMILIPFVALWTPQAPPRIKKKKNLYTYDKNKWI